MIGGLPTFDIESVNWINPIAVGFYDGYNYHEFIRKSEEEDIIWEFLTYLKENCKGIKLYAHCASKYDSKFILSSLCQRKEVVRLELGLIRLRWVEPNITFEDSYLLCPMSLSKLNKMFEVEEKGEWKHEKHLKPWEMGESLSTFREYMKNDCLSLSHSLYRLCELLGYTFGAMPSVSLSTTAVKIFDKCFYDIRKIEPNEPYDEFIREAIYGGRNEVYRRYGEDIRMYDVKSMFVSCYDTPVPIGKMRWVKQNIDKGILAEATVKVPKDWYIGPLPYRLESSILAFPVGEFTSWWDMAELRFAASLGVDITIRRQLSCEEEPALEEFGKFISKLRGAKYDAYWKLFGLSLSGKFGQTRWRDIVKHVSELKDFKGFTPMDDREEYFTGKAYSNSRNPYIKPAISMRIRSEARIRHQRMILEALKSGDVFYSDTDSIFTTASLPIGEETGMLSFLGEAERGYFIRQKLYAVIQKGKLKQRSAGYSDSKLEEGDFKDLIGGKSKRIDIDALPSYPNILKKSEIALIERSRLIKGTFRSNRILEGNDSQPILLTSSKN